MLRKPASIIILSLLMVSALALAFNVQPVKSDYTWTQTIYIYADGSISPTSAPISRVDTVTYALTDNIAGNVTANSSAIVIQRDNITIDGAGYTLQGIQASNSLGINLTQAAARNVTIKNMKIKAFDYCIYIGSSSNNSISGNTITANNWNGIYLDGSSNNSVSGNNIVNSWEGIMLDSSSNNSVSGNNITASNAYGIGLLYSSNNSVTGNNLANNGEGIYLYSSSNNSASGNNITANTWGIYLYSSSNNTIYNDNMNNTSQVYSSGSTNVWDNGYPSGGNYWSDYNGTDVKSGASQTQAGYDGIGDTSYIIDNNNTDRYPLMQPLTGAGVLIVQTPTGSNVPVSPTVNVTVTFANVTAVGFTSLNTAQPPTNQFVSVTCNEIRTSATYTGNVTLQFAYDPSGLSLKDQQAMKIWLWNQSSSCWVDLTTFVNTTSHAVYGVSPHLSMFGVTSNLGITGDLAVQGTTNVSIPIAPPALPHSLVVLNYYQINTTKTLLPPINISLAYKYGITPPGEEVFTQVWMWNDTSASWVDITTGVNTADHMVYGSAPHLSMFGVTSLPQPINGITVTSASCPKTVVCQGYGANVSVTVCNQGAFQQTNFNVTLFCNTTLLATYHIDQLNSNGQIILNLTWNTAGWAKGNYSVSTCYIDSTGSTYYIDNVGWIKVSTVGDLTGGTGNVWDFVPDGKCDGKDISVAAKCFGSYPGCSPPVIWNANCDVTNDGKVDGKDIAIVAKHFGQADP